MVELRSLTFAYPASPPLFLAFNWRVRQGETWAVLGPSGCGKTTLLYLLAGLLRPTSGEVLIAGQPLLRPRLRTGLILQEYGLLPWATVRQNAELGLRVRRLYRAEGSDGSRSDRQDVDLWLKRLGIADVANKYPSQISGGQRQRTAIARALAIRPDLLLMDEPFSSLDAVTREDLQALTLELCAEQGLTLIIVTHSIEEAALMGRRILLMGEPPHREARVFENPHAGHPDHKESDEYRHLCRVLREEMAREAA